MTELAHESAHIIQQRYPDFKPSLCMVLGSGLGKLAAEIEKCGVISFHELPGFHVPQVEGHSGKVHLGYLGSLPIVCLEGRAHYYEGINNYTMQTMVRTFHLLGCKTWLATNAAGSLRTDITPGSLVIIKDHINFQFKNPLVGVNDPAFGPRFVPMENAYDFELRQQLLTLGKTLNIPLVEGVYLAVLGPAFETPAEIRAFQILGADLVGMSTIAEVICARHCGMKVAVISAVTNMAAGLSHEAVTHELTLQGAKIAAENLKKLVLNFVEQSMDQ